MINTRKTYKIIKRTISLVAQDNRLSTEETKSQDDDVVVVRVKRTAQMRNDVEELELEFCKNGDVKR